MHQYTFEFLSNKITRNEFCQHPWMKKLGLMTDNNDLHMFRQAH